MGQKLDPLADAKAFQRKARPYGGGVTWEDKANPELRDYVRKLVEAFKSGELNKIGNRPWNFVELYELIISRFGKGAISRSTLTRMIKQ